MNLFYKVIGVGFIILLSIVLFKVLAFILAPVLVFIVHLFGGTTQEEKRQAHQDNIVSTAEDVCIDYNNKQRNK